MLLFSFLPGGDGRISVRVVFAVWCGDAGRSRVLGWSDILFACKSGARDGCVEQARAKRAGLFWTLRGHLRERILCLCGSG